MAVAPGLIFTIIVTALGASFQFYNFAVVNTPQNIVEDWVNRTYLNKGVDISSSTLTLIWSLYVGILCVGALCGSAVTATVAENVGRRNGLILNGVVNVIGGLCEFFPMKASSPELLFVGRLILGFNVGLACGLAPMYLTEIAPISQRGAAGTAHQIASSFSDCFCLFLTLPFILGSETLWPFAFAFPALPALILVILLPFTHESPRYLMMAKGDRVKAEKSIRFYTPAEDFKKTFENLIKEAALSEKNLSRHGKPTIKKLFTDRSLRTPLLISIFVMVAQQFTGCAAVFAYSTDMFLQADLTIDVARLCTVAVGICYFVFTLPAAFFIEKAGRRKLSIIQLSGCSFALILTSIFTSLQHRYGMAWASYGCIGSLLLYMCIYGFGSPVPWLIASELFGQEFRSLAVAFCTFTAFLCALIVSFGYLPFQRAVGVEFSFLPFVISMAIAVGLIYLLLPETKNKSIQEIVNEFRRNKNALSRRITFRYSMSTEDEYEPLTTSTGSEQQNGYTNGAHKTFV